RHGATVAATSASGAVPSRASSSAAPPWPDGLGMPSLHCITLTAFSLRPASADTRSSLRMPSRLSCPAVQPAPWLGLRYWTRFSSPAVRRRCATCSGGSGGRSGELFEVWLEGVAEQQVGAVQPTFYRGQAQPEQPADLGVAPPLHVGQHERLAAVPF